jgi:hypothetical protein
MSLQHFIDKTKKRRIYADFENVDKNAKKLRNFMYIQPKMLDLDPDSMNQDPENCQYLPILDSFSNSVCLLRMTGSSSPRSSVMFTMTVFSLLACAPMSRPYSDMESSLPQHRISLLRVL